MKRLAIGLIGVARWANEPCERHDQAELSKGASMARFRIPGKQSRPVYSTGGAVGAQKVTKVLWGRGFAIQPNGNTTGAGSFACSSLTQRP